MILKTLVVLLGLAVSQTVATPKKGFGLCGSLFKCGDTFALSGASWWYNWHATMEEYHWKKCHTKPRGEFVPMIWSAKNLNDHIPPESKHVLGFNEPNAHNQANLTPEQAAAHWHQLMKIAGNRVLVSPAPYGCDSNPDMCINWLDRFMHACHNCKVDRIAIHGYHCDVKKWEQAINKIYNHFKKRIWITEVGCTVTNDVNHYINFMKELVPTLEKHWAVERYAWFCTRLHAGKHSNWNLLNMDHPTLSKLGQVYNTNH